MARKLREVHPDLPHHVILRGNNRRRLFSRPGDYTRFISFLAEALRKHDVALHGLTLMANHVHAILRPRARDGLVHAVKSAAQRYAVHRNRQRDGTGKLFEQRYSCTAVTTDEYLGAVTCYNDLNPVRAGIVADPLAFRWSTYPLHAGQPTRSAIPAEMWTPSAWYLALGDDPLERAARYAHAAWAYLQGALPEGHAAVTAAAEALTTATYHRRLERPDRTRADESSATYGELRGMPEKPYETGDFPTGE
jgi:putative transposase